MRNVIKKVMVVLMAMCILVGMTPVSIQAATKTVTYKAYKEKVTNTLIVLLKNNTKNDVGVETTVNFYDKAGEEVGKATETVNVVFGKCEYAQIINAPSTEAGEAIPYSKYKVSVKAIKAEPYDTQLNPSKITSKVGSYNKKQEAVEVNYKNNGKEACSSVDTTVFFFKDKKFVASDSTGAPEMQPNGTSKVYISDTYNGTRLKYDSIKIVLNFALKYDPNADGGY